MTFGIIGSGSWATALAKILTDKKHSINWWIRNTDAIDYIKKNSNNPNYLRSAKFDTSLLTMSPKIEDVVAQSNVLVVAVPSAYVEESLGILRSNDFKGKKVVSAIKGLLPEKNIIYKHNLVSPLKIILQYWGLVMQRK